MTLLKRGLAILGDREHLRNRWLVFIVLVVVVILMVYIVMDFVPVTYDWNRHFRPATLKLLSGRSPYEVETFYNPVWILLPMLPLALLPLELSSALLFVISFAAFVFVAVRLGAKPLGVVVLMLSYPVFNTLICGQTEWLVALGLVLPPQIGLFLLLAKPQAVWGVVLYWLVEAWRQGGLREAVRRFAPVSLALAANIAVFGTEWIFRAVDTIDRPWNTSLWPYAIPIGLVLLVKGLRERQQRMALMASGFLSPYLGVQSWAMTLMGLLPDTLVLTAAVVGVWVVLILVGGPGG